MQLAAWLRFDRAVLAAAIILTGVIFTAQAADPVNVIKMTALALCAIVLLTSAVVRVVVTRVAQVPVSLPALVGVILLIAFVVATVTAPVTTQAVLGSYGRNSGLLTYGSVLVLFLVGLRVLDRRSAGTVLIALIAAGTFTASYGLLQYFGTDPVPWNNPFNPIISTLGNPNFAAAYLAICTPAAVWGALRVGWATPWRVFSGVVAVMCVVAALLSDAAQGPLALAPGLAILALAWLLDQPRRVRSIGIAVLGGVTAVGAAGLLAGVAGSGPAASVFRDAGSRARLYYWDAALTMWRDNPIFGVGLETYGGYWRMVRSPEAVRALVASDFTDSAHSVPLHLLSTGGILLGGSYLAFLGVVAAALVMGLVRLAGPERLLLGALGGSWAAYQVQSFVSIDQVPLSVTQYVLASGIVVVAGWSRLREFRLPGAPRVPVTPAAKRGRRPAVQAVRPRALTGADYALVSLVALAALLLSWQSLVPLRANAAIAEGDGALARGNGSAALRAYADATRLVPGQSFYWQKRGSFYRNVQRPEQALDDYARAVEVNRFELDAVRETAKLAEEQGRIDEARRLYERAVELDPRGPATLLAAATFELRHEGAARAIQLLEQGVGVTPGRADLWAALGDARAVTGDPAGARQAYERALVLQADEPTATAGLAKLAAPV